MILWPDIDPVIFHITDRLVVTWYAMSYAVGLLLGWWYAYRVVARFPLGINATELESFITYFMIGMLVGGRLGYVLFYDLAEYIANPMEIIKTYKGGMSFHGAIIGILCSSYLFCRNTNISFLSILDISTLVCPIGIFLGRIANFINAELYGRITNVPWGIVFPDTDGAARHPSQIYEALTEGLATLLILYFYSYRNKKILHKGRTAGMWSMLYACFRFAIEFFREPSVLVMGVMPIGQVFSVLMFIIGIKLYRESFHAKLVQYHIPQSSSNHNILSLKENLRHCFGNNHKKH